MGFIHFYFVFFFKDDDEAIHLFREVVLLTEDRHLRMKAHTRNVPVKEILNFCKWCGAV
jgi:protein SMG6